MVISEGRWLYQRVGGYIRGQVVISDRGWVVISEGGWLYQRVGGYIRGQLGNYIRLSMRVDGG